MDIPWTIMVMLVASGVLVGLAIGLLLRTIFGTSTYGGGSSPSVNVELHVHGLGDTAEISHTAPPYSGGYSEMVGEGAKPSIQEGADSAELFVGAQDEVDIGGSVGKRSSSGGAEDTVDALSKLT